MTDRVRWGILGTGNIANKMAEALKSLPEAELAAVGSRAQDSANQFADKWDIPTRHPSYEALAQDESIDIVYVSTPHPFHEPCTVLCLEHGRAVLCEKPFALNSHEAEKMVIAARTHRLFLMEAMWTRFLPALQKTKELIEGGAIGELRMLQADFGFRAGLDPQGRLLNLDLGGGALLDVGVYTVSLAQWLLGEPAKMHTMASLGDTGVDEQNALMFGYESGAIAVLTSAVRTNTPHMAYLMGTDGMIRIPGFWAAREMTLSAGGKEERFELPYEGNGFEFQALECMERLRAGDVESKVMPLEDTLSVMRTMDAVREQWGLVYPNEADPV